MVILIDTAAPFWTEGLESASLVYVPYKDGEDTDGVGRIGVPCALLVRLGLLPPRSP